jgi:NADPH-dependent glutamate synthase beta subunit-like oxidoreductase
MRPLRCAIIGAGPAGFYAAQQLLEQGFDVDLLDTLPTPFGLVRSGVAPDHPKIKSVTRVFEKTAAHPGLRFFGGVELGADVQRADLLEHYHAVVYAVGTASERPPAFRRPQLRPVGAARGRRRQRQRGDRCRADARARPRRARHHRHG